MAKIAVAPLVGAWIEIDEYGFDPYNKESLPSWERGLKYIDSESSEVVFESLPSWERGLKLSSNRNL